MSSFINNVCKARGDASHEHVSYWRQQVSPNPPPLALAAHARAAPHIMSKGERAASQSVSATTKSQS